MNPDSQAFYHEMSKDIENDPLVPKKMFRTIKAKYEKEGKNKKKQKPASASSVWRLLSYTFREHTLFGVGIVLLALSQLATIYLPLITGQIIDVLLKYSDFSKLKEFCLKFLGTFLISGVALFFRNICFTLIAERVTVSLKNETFSRFISFDIEFFENKKTGELLSRLGSDIATMKTATSSDISVLLKSLVVAIGSFIIMFTINIYLSLIILAVVPFFILITSLFSNYTKKYNRSYQDIMAEGSVIAEECFSNIRTVKAFSTEEEETQHFQAVNKKAYTVAIKKVIMAAAYRATTHLIINTGVLGVLWYGGYCVISGTLSSGQLVSFLIYANDYTDTASSISACISSILSAAGVAEGLFKIMDYKPKINNNKGGLPGDFEGNIEFKNVNFAYPSSPDVKVLEDLNLKINEGEVLAICGGSGGGKSTIITLLERFYDVSSGILLINHKDIKDYDIKELHRKIGYVSQEPVLFSGTIEENITYGVTAYRQSELIKVCKWANALDFITDKESFPLGFQTLVGEKGLKLSGGQKQRIAIARALMKDPKILIFDEATSALDAEAESQVQKAIDLLMKKGDLTMIIIAHRLSTIVKCRRIVVMARGKIEEEGDHETLWKLGGTYKSLVEKQMELGNFKEKEEEVDQLKI